MQVSKVLGSLISAYIIYCIARFFRSYQTARKIGLPICVCPINFEALPWRILSVPLRPFIQQYFPEWLAFRLEMATYGSEFVLRDRVVKKYGSAVVLCGIGPVQLWCADAGLSTLLLQKPKEFPPSGISQEIIGMAGPNIVSTNGETWQRQRRIIAPMINERISAATWKETISQAEAMVKIYQKAGLHGTHTSIRGLKQIAFNVLGAVAYGKHQSWEDPLEQTTDSNSNSAFLDILLCLTNNLVIAALLPTRLLLSPVMPSFIRKAGQALLDFPKVTDGLIAEERRNRSASNNLMSTVVKFTDGEKEMSKLHLTPEEITGNLLVFTIAGYDTTANTMAFALTNLAVYPYWQDWIREEIDNVSKNGEEYDLAFPQLKRVLALMLETLRLYTPLLHALRCNLSPVTFKTDEGTECTIPPGTEVQISLTTIHVNPKYWGDDALEFRPSRWIQEDGSILEPAKGTFMPWSTGPRNCPGTKMAQVEFVSAFYTIFKHCKIEPVLRQEETVETARARLKAVMMDSLPIITLQMNQPEEVKLQWLERD